MKKQKNKCVLIINRTLPAGLAANTAAILSCSFGRLHPELISEDVEDRNGRNTIGIIQIPVPVLCADEDEISRIRRKLVQDEFSEMEMIEFTELAQSCRTYPEFIERMKQEDCQTLPCSGLLLFGDRHEIAHLSGSLPLYR